MKRIVLFVLTLLFAGLASAHLDAGEDTVVEGSLIAFGYDPANILVGEPVTLAYNLVNESTDEIIARHSVWRRVSEEDTVYFAGYMYPEADHVSMLYTFPRSGDYILTTRFELENGQKISTDFTVDATAPFPSTLVVVGISALFVGIVLTAIYLKR